MGSVPLVENEATRANDPSINTVMNTRTEQHSQLGSLPPYLFHPKISPMHTIPGTHLFGSAHNAVLTKSAVSPPESHSYLLLRTPAAVGHHAFASVNNQFVVHGSFHPHPLSLS